MEIQDFGYLGIQKKCSYVSGPHGFCSFTQVRGKLLFPLVKMKELKIMYLSLLQCLSLQKNEEYSRLDHLYTKGEINILG